jgi:hypothetical protein
LQRLLEYGHDPQDTHRRRREFAASRSNADRVAIANAADPQGHSIVYISNDPRWGTLTLTLQNNTPGGITLDAASTVLKLFVAPLLTNDEIEKIELASPDWAKSFPSDNGQLYLQLNFAAPNAVIVAAGQTVAIQLKNVQASGSSGPGRFLAEYSGFKPAKDGSQRIPVQRQLPPDQGKNWPLPPPGFRSRDEYGGSHDQGKSIYVTPWSVTSPANAISNNFVLEIATSEMLTFGTPKPSIFVSFLSGDGEAALCSDDDITSMIADIDQSPGTWGVSKQGTADLPVFVAAPGADNGSFDPAAGPLAIRFSNLISMLPPDKSSLIFVQCTGLSAQGYNDTVFVQFIDKVQPTPYITSFAAYNGNTPVPQGGTVDYGHVTLKWNVFAAQLCLVEETGQTGKAIDTAIVPAQQPLTKYNLQPQVGSTEFDSRDVSFNVTPPKIDQLSFSPNAVAPGGPSTLSWSCSNAAYVRVTGSNGAVIIDNAPLTSSVAVNAGPVDTTFQFDCVGAGTVTAPATLSVPPPNPFIWAQLNVTGPPTTFTVVVQWHADYATSCAVYCVDTGQLLSTDLISTCTLPAPMVGNVLEGPKLFRIVAVGRGTVTVDGPTHWLW